MKDAIGVLIMLAYPSASPFVPEVPGRNQFTLELSKPPLISGGCWSSFWIEPRDTENYNSLYEILTIDIIYHSAPGRTFSHSIDHSYIVPTSRHKLAQSVDLIAGAP